MRLRLTSGAGGALDVEGGRIATTDRAADLELSLGDVELRPGLVNAHDHLHRNHYPRLGEPPYADAYAWGEDVHRRFAGALERGRTLPRRTAFLFGALKNLLGGVTTVVHHDPWEDDLASLPLRVRRLSFLHSLGFGGAVSLAPPTSGKPTSAVSRTRPDGAPLSLHLAEGTSPRAASEVREAGARGLLAGALAVHLVGVSERDVHLLRDAGAAAVLCPSSNDFLLHALPPPALLSSDLDLLLGSDSLLTAAGTLLHELAFARGRGLLDDERLVAAVSTTAARRVSVPAPSVQPGAPADLIALRRPLLECSPGDVALVLVGGEPRLADETFGELFERQGVRTRPLTVGGVTKLAPVALVEAAEDVFSLTPECARILGS